MPKLGDFVTAKLFRVDDVRQGVLIVIGSEFSRIRGISGTIYDVDNDCITVVPDRNLLSFDDRAFVAAERSKLEKQV